MAFQRAERKRAFVKVALTGPSGSGKTYSALLLAFGLAPGGKVAMVDSENGSGSMYAQLGEYDVQEIAPPFTTEKYEAAIAEACRAGYDVLIIDSMTHAWAGEGGLLAQKDALDGNNKAGKFQNWGPITRQQDRFIGSILHAPIHVVATIRAKQEYQVTPDGKVQKLGMAPVQREGVDYEFSTVFDLARNHVATCSKDRTGLFDKLAAPLSAEHGHKLRTWLDGGAVTVAQAETPAADEGADPRRRHFFGVWSEVYPGWSDEKRHAWLSGVLNRPVASWNDLSEEEQLRAVARIDAEQRGDAAKMPGQMPGQMPEQTQRAQQAVRAAEVRTYGAQTGAAAAMTCSSPDCGKALTKGQHDVSMRAFGQPLCPGCQKEQARAA